MCGICGIIEQKRPPDCELIETMMGAMKHRGPDSSGYYIDRHAAIGHTRLAIIDLYTGQQPLSNEDESLWISFNGEIYNYIELRNILIDRGHVFRTESDTETILHSWEEWGPDCFNKFNGQWAIAIWDSIKRECILSRDRYGIRPLYYTKNNNRFLFASEIKAIFCDRSINRDFDPTGMSEIFTFWSTVAPVTAYEGISELPPGHYGILKNNNLNSQPYWNIDFPLETEINTPNHNRDIESYTSEFKELLIDAARLRFTRSDVPVGAYLSVELIRL